MSHPLFQEFKIRDLTIPNRVWVSPMCQYSAIDGRVGQWHQVHLGAFATGGAGLIFVEAKQTPRCGVCFFHGVRPYI